MKEITIVFFALILFSTLCHGQKERALWEFGGGLRFNYQGLSGGYEGERFSDGYKFKMDYHEIGMDNYSPSVGLAFGGCYKKWNLAFAGSTGSCKGEFETKFDIIRDDIQIDSGATVNGQIKETYNFYKGDNWSYNASLGFRKLFMDMYKENDYRLSEGNRSLYRALYCNSCQILKCRKMGLYKT